MQYTAVSLSRAGVPPPPHGLKAYPIHVDLHTSKSATPGAGWAQLLRDLKKGIEENRCGIMIHHQRMNGAAHEFLEMLLKAIAQRKRLRAVSFREMTEKKGFKGSRVQGFKGKATRR
jgi:hypothetical protein